MLCPPPIRRAIHRSKNLFHTLLTKGKSKVLCLEKTKHTGSSSGSLKHRLVRGAAGSFALKIVSTGLALLTSILLSRLLGAAGFGIFAYAIAWTSLLSIPATLGLDKLIVREVAIYQTRSAWGLMHGILRWANQIVFLVSVGLALVAAAVAWSLGKGNESQMLTAFCIALVSLPLTSLRNLRLAAMKGLHQVVMGLLPELLIAPLLLITLTVGAYLLLGEKLTASWVVGMHIVATGISFVMGMRLLEQALPSPAKEAMPEYRVRDWVSSALPLMFLGGMQIINSKTDILMLGAIAGAKAVGVYTVISRGAQLISFILMAVNSVMAPTIASFYADKKMKQLQRVVTKSARAVLLISFLVAAILVGGSHWFLLLFGSEFTQGQKALAILSIGQLVNAATGSVGLLLTMTGHERHLAISVGASAILNVIGNALLIPQWGVDGAAIATASSTTFVNIFKAIWVRKKLGIDPTGLGKIS